ncbi:hypothetical protein HMI55_002863, partial [Coelomomyces lativittatus]
MTSKGPWESSKFPCDPCTPSILGQTHDLTTSFLPRLFSPFTESSVNEDSGRDLAQNKNTESNLLLSQSLNTEVPADTEIYQRKKDSPVNQAHGLQVSPKFTNERDGHSMNYKELPPVLLRTQSCHSTLSTHGTLYHVARQSPLHAASHATIPAPPTQSLSVDPFISDHVGNSSLYQNDTSISISRNTPKSEVHSEFTYPALSMSCSQQLSDSVGIINSTNESIEVLNHPCNPHSFVHSNFSPQETLISPSENRGSHGIILPQVGACQQIRNHKKIKTLMQMDNRNSYSRSLGSLNHQNELKTEVNIPCQDLSHKSCINQSGNP